jgi:AP-3 complex subunit delta-1
LFTSHELNPVALIAQASVPIPEGLDLDAWIVPSQQERVIEEEAEDVRKAKKSKKGKGKEINGTKVKSGKRKQKDGDPRDAYTVPEPEIETIEERAERERVLFFFGKAYSLCR